MHEKLKTQLTELRLHGMERVLEAEIEGPSEKAPQAWSFFRQTAHRRSRLSTRAQPDLPLAGRSTTLALDAAVLSLRPPTRPSIRRTIHTLAALTSCVAMRIYCSSVRRCRQEWLAIGLLREACLNGYRGSSTIAAVAR